MATDENSNQVDLSRFTSNIPPFPKCVQRVLTMLRDPRIQLTKVAEVVSLDQGFAGKVLRMANSAYFGLPRRVYNVTEALVLLGYANVRNVLISASASNILSTAVEAYRLDAGCLWEHSVGTAYAAQMLSRKIGMQVYSMAFSCGLLHDVGKVAIDLALLDESKAEMRSLIRSRGVLAAELASVGVTHSQVGGEICRRWNLPEEIIDAVSYHHNPRECSENRVIAGVVATADKCSHLLLEGSNLTVHHLADLPDGSYVPDAQSLHRLSEELPAMVASSKELLQAVAEPEPEHLT